MFLPCEKYLSLGEIALVLPCLYNWVYIHVCSCFPLPSLYVCTHMCWLCIRRANYIYLHLHVRTCVHVRILFSLSFSSFLPVFPSFLFQDPGGQQVGFLLGSLGVSVALTSEATAKALPKEEGKDHIVHFKVLYMHMYIVSVVVRGGGYMV